MNPYKEYIREIAENLKNAKDFPLGNFNFPKRKSKSSHAPIAVILSPHPDDECIIGGLPLRLFYETNFRVINIPITLGSILERREPRKEELLNACKFLGFEVKFLSDNGYEQISSTGRKENPENWAMSVNKLKTLFEELDPEICFFPHAKDKHPEHCGTNTLGLEALSQMPEDFSCFTVETEFWQAMEKPNVMVEFDEQIVSELVTALTFHIGEVQRNPYHLSLPAWFIDNVRRGSEILGSLGAKSQDYTFAGLYKISIYKHGKQISLSVKNKFISADQNVESIFEKTSTSKT